MPNMSFLTSGYSPVKETTYELWRVTNVAGIAREYMVFRDSEFNRWFIETQSTRVTFTDIEKLGVRVRQTGHYPR